MISSNKRAILEAAHNIANRLNLPYDWLNSDFVSTSSYSPRLREISKYYRTFSNVLEVRVVDREYLAAMKLRASREYKNDLSDVIGIINQNAQFGTPIVKEDIISAYEYLYKEPLTGTRLLFLDEIYNCDNLNLLYQKYRNQEINTKDLLIDFEQQYPETLDDDNINEITAALRTSIFSKENNE